MTLRTKSLLALLALAAAATVSIGSLAYVATQQQLNAEIDNALRDVAAYSVAQGGGRGGPHDGPSDVRLQTVLVQDLNADGTVRTAPGGISVPVSAADRAVASGARTHQVYRDVTVSGQHYRMLTTPAEHGGAVQVLRPLSERNDVLSTLRLKILLAAIVVIAAAAVTGWLLARQITRRLSRLAAAAGLIAATGRLDVAMPVSGTDEVTQVASAFQRMLDALRRSEVAQRRLVQDAGHELRTPLTSLRTNLDVLGRYPDLPDSQRDTVLADLHSETRELSTLVNELVDLTSGDAPAPAPEYVRLADIAGRVVDRAQRRSGRHIHLRADDSTVLGQRGALERAIGNLIDNALKFSPDPAPVEVTVAQGRVEVRDHGPGLAHEDLPRIFDRFYRADHARPLPGSGLGLAIVHDVATNHGGSVLARNHPDAGAVIGFVLPVIPPPVSEQPTGGFTPSSNPA